MNLLTRTSEQRWAPNAGELAPVRNVVNRVWGLRIDPARRLENAEQHQLIQLVRAAGEGTEAGINLSQLDRKQRASLEALIEKAGALEPGSLKKQRQAVELKQKVEELARPLRRQKRPRYEEAGAVVLPQEMFEHLRDHILWAEHVGLFVLVAQQLENGTALSPSAAVENTGDGDPALVVDASLGVLGGDLTEEGLPRWQQHLKHLEVNEYLAVERTGHEWRISYGTRAKRHQRGRAS